MACNFLVVSVNRLTFWAVTGPLLRYQNQKEVNPIISVQAKLEIRGDIKAACLSRELDEANVNRETLKAVVVKAQDQLIDELCGKKYARNKDAKFKRAGTVTKNEIKVILGKDGERARNICWAQQ